MLAGCAKKAPEPEAMGPPPEMMEADMMVEGEAAEEPAAEEAMGAAGYARSKSAPSKSALQPGGPGGRGSRHYQSVDGLAAGETRTQAPRPRALDKNAYYSSTYLGGGGERDRIEKLIGDGVVVGGKTVKLAAFTREYSQAFEIPTKQALNVHVDLEQSKIAKQGGEVHLQVGLQAIKREAPKRPPVNLCVVIDRSGSMADEGKLSYAKKAATDIIEGLSPSDYLGIVVYDDAVNVLVPSAKLTSKAAAKKKVASLGPGGSTNIYDALRAGYAEAKKHFSKESINQVLLLSDGMVTAGVEDPYAFRELARKMADGDIQTTTVGMGIEFDETIMMDVAQHGRGNYHFIKDASQTQEIFQKELGRLTRAVAKAVKVRIELTKGVELVRVLGSSALGESEAEATKRTEQKIDQKVYDELGIRKDRKKEDEPGIKMLIPHFYAGDSHVVMLRVRVPRGSGSREVAQVEVKYKDLVFKKNREDKRSAKITYAKDKAAVVASISRPVKKNVLGFKTGEALLKAGEYVKQGRTSEAVRAIDEQMVVLGVAAKEWNDKDLDRDGELLDRYKYVMASAGGGSLANTDLGNYLAKSLTYSGYELTR